MEKINVAPKIQDSIVSVLIWITEVVNISQGPLQETLLGPIFLAKLSVLALVRLSLAMADLCG